MLNTHNPSQNDIEEIYRNLENFKSVLFSVSENKIVEICRDLEICGFVALKIIQQRNEMLFNIKAWKGKHGPCYDTKRTVIYEGEALAVIDDDYHVLIRGDEQAICEKTAQVHMLTPYVHSKVSGGTEVKSEDMPLPFDCDDLDQCTRVLLEKIEKTAEEDCVQLFYTGPYKVVVLEDGSIMRRGVVNRISNKWAELCKQEGAIENKNALAPEVKYFNLQTLSDTIDAFVKNPPAKNGQSAELVFKESCELEMNACDHILPKFKNKLLKVIENKQTYFLLTGSDPDDKLGCCPSEEVGSANSLVQAGVLSKIQAESDSQNCPVQIYAFRNEIKDLEKFEIDFEFRKKVEKRLLKKRSSTIIVIRTILLLVVLGSVLIGLTNELSKDHAQKIELVDLTQTKEGVSYHLILFHATKRCEMCLNMEAFAKEFQLMKSPIKEIDFVMSNMDSKELNALVDDNNIFTSTLFLLVKKDKRVVYEKCLKDLWEAYRSKDSFMKILEREVAKSGYPK